jgi:hypothetical protein
MIYTSNRALRFYAGPKQCKGHLYQELLFFYAYLNLLQFLY